MKERQQFSIPANGQLVVVTVEVYNEFYKMDRRERYLEERDRAKGKILFSDLDPDEMRCEEALADADAKSVEQTVLDAIMVDKLQKCLVLLPDDERELINALFFDGYSEREWEAITGVPRRTIAYRKNKILSKLKKVLEN